MMTTNFDQILPRIVLLPGMDGTGALFADFVAALSAEYSTVIVSYPADRSLSYAELEERVAKVSLDSGPFVLLAESFSCPLAIRMAAKRPPGLAGLVLCAGFAASPMRGPLRFAAWMSASMVFRVPFAALALRALLIGKDAPLTLPATVRSAILSVRPDVLADRLRAVLTCDERVSLAVVEVPMLYMQAEDDRVVPPSCLAEIQAIRPDVRVAQIAGPHLLLQSRPREAANVVGEFIRGLQAGEAESRAN